MGTAPAAPESSQLGERGVAQPLEGHQGQAAVVLEGRACRWRVGSTLFITTFPAQATRDHHTGSFSKIH